MYKFPQFFKAACHPVRQKILSLLRDKVELSVNDLVRELGLAQATVSHHLAILKSANVIKVRKEGTQSKYSLCCDTFNRCCLDMQKFIKCCRK